MHPYPHYVNPHLGELLAQVNMDKQYVKAKDQYLYDQDRNRYLDFIAAYGALPLGHNPEVIWQALEEIRTKAEPNFVQPSYLEAAGKLAERLITLAGNQLRYVTFTNSGAETVEAAIKMARAATGRFKILSTKNSFHGKTLAALSATGNPNYQTEFFAPLPGFTHIPFGDLEALEATLVEDPEGYAAFIVEPIQGEGGINVPPPGYLRAAKEICSQYGVLFVVDEIQTGLGRTGVLFASAAEVEPDIMLLAKALGGGLVPIGACLASATAYTEAFGLKHSSTFAGNAMGCRAGLAILDYMAADNWRLLREVQEKGEFLLAGFREIQARYPEVITDVRGRGFMIGLEFNLDREDYPDSLLGIMAEQGMLTPVISSYLLNCEKLRVAPTLNGHAVVRIEPPLIVTKEDCQYALEAVERVASLIHRKDTAGLVRHLAPQPEQVQPVPPRPIRPKVEVSPAQSEEGRFAFLVHPLELRNYVDFDGSLRAFSKEQLDHLVSRFSELMEPFVIATTRIKSPTGASAYGEFIVVPHTAKQLSTMRREQAVEHVKRAVLLAKDNGAQIVGLGAYTSVVTRGGWDVRNLGVAVTTGNSYTVVSAVEAAIAALDRLGRSLDKVTTAVVGATGAIGRAVSLLLAEQVPQLILIGNPQRPKQAERRLREISHEICQRIAEARFTGVEFPATSLASHLLQMPLFPTGEPGQDGYGTFLQTLGTNGSPLVLTTDADKYLPKADLIIVATNSVEELIAPTMLKHGCVVCDLSRPANVSHRVKEERPDVLVIDGGVVQVPGQPIWNFDFGFEDGVAYACMSETFMLALEKRYENISLGVNLDLETLLLMRTLAKKHGFRLAGLRSFDRPLSEEAWQRVWEAQRQTS